MGRVGGNSEILARAAAAALPTEVEQSWLNLTDLSIPDFEDVRHDPGSGAYAMPVGDAAHLLDETLAATDLVFVAPLYWYSLPTRAKAYLDHWSGWLRVPGVNFKARMAGRTVWSITALSDENRAVANPLIECLRLTADYMHMRWGGALLGYGNRPGEVLEDTAAVAEAGSFFATVAPRALRAD